MRIPQQSVLEIIVRPPVPLRALLALCVLAAALPALGFFNLYGFRRAGEFLLVFLWLAYLASLARGKLRDGLLVLSSVVFGLTALEGLAAKSEKATFPIQGKGFSVDKPGLGWGPAGPGRYPARKIDPQTGAVIYDVTYTIDDSFLRKTVSADAGPTVAFFGDSFTFGEGVNDHETMPQAYADLTRRTNRVLNLGFPGYGPQQLLYALESGLHDALLGPEVRLFVSMTVPWHVERTACKAAWTPRAPRYVIENDRIRYKGACSQGPGRLLRNWLENTALYRVAIAPYRQRIDRDDVDLYIRILVAAVDLAKQKYGVATLIPYIPAGDYYLRETGFSDEMIVTKLREGGAIVIDASLAQEEAEGAVIGIPGDGHPSPFAHSARARAIKDYMDQEMSVAEFTSRR